MIGFDEAIELVRSIATPLGTESAQIAEAAKRVLARPVIAEIDSPREDVSSMDGYAVRDADLKQLPVSLNLVGDSFAGAGWDGAVEPGACARIFTGAPVPRGADRVVIQEDVRRDGDLAIINSPPGPARYIRDRGSDFARGDELLPARRLLDPRALVAAAAADVGQLEIYRRPRVSILSTGDELAEPGTARNRTDAIPDSVSLGVAALTGQWGGECIGCTLVRDEFSAMEDAARTAAELADVVVVTGGASVGEKDFAKAMFEPLGLRLAFSKVAIKPGKPAWLGRTRDAIVIGLPGNPTSAMVTARLFLAPLLAGLSGRRIEDALRWRLAPLATPLPPCAVRETFHRARCVDGAAEVLAYQDSGAQKALASAELLVRQRADSPAINPGAAVEVLDF